MTAPVEKKTVSLFSPTGQDDLWLLSANEILAVLTQMRNQTTTIWAYTKGRRDSIPTSILGILRDRNLLVLDEGPDDRQNAGLLSAGHASCVTIHDNIHIRFEAENLEKARYKGRGVFVCPIPKEVYYRQRRKYFRVPTSVLKPPICYVPQPDQESPLELNVADISAGGVGLHDLTGALRLDVEPPYPLSGCTLYLPDFAELDVDLQVRHQHRLTFRDGTKAVKIGAMFVGLRPGTRNHIQQYVTRLQVQQLTLARH